MPPTTSSPSTTPAPAPDSLFDAFLEGLLLTPGELAAARDAADPVIGILRRLFHPDADAAFAAAERSDHLVAGSVGKRTAIRPLSGVDLFYLLPAPAAPADALEHMEGALRAALPDAPIGMGDGRLFVDQGGVVVAVSPAVERQGAFAIPRGDGWVMSNPVAEMAALRLSDAVTGGRTTRLLALLKAWKSTCGAPLPAFTLEILAREFMGEMGAGSAGPWPGMLADFFAWARRFTPCMVDLPGGLSRLAVDDAWHPAAEAAYWRCVLAARNAASGDAEAALGEWRHLFGTAFGAASTFNMGPTFSIWNVRPDLG